MCTKFALTVLVSLMVSSMAFAQESPATVGDLEKVQAQTELLKAQVAKATAADDLRSKDGQSSAAGVTEGLPGIKAVFGRDNHLFATFVFPGGSTMDAKTGDAIEPGMYVQSIAIDRVVVRWHGTKYPLGFSTLPPVTGHGQQGSQVPQGPMPPMPGMGSMTSNSVGAGN